MANLGLRVGEVVEIKVDEIDLVKNKIRVHTEKAHTGDFLYLHSSVRKLLYLWIENFQDEIMDHEGYVLFSENKSVKRQNISSNWLRKYFREICYIANLNEFYGYADDSGNNREMENRKLYRLTTHSLRHYYITHIYNGCKNPLHTQKLARHRSFKSTQVYIHSSPEELEQTMKTVFEGESVNVNEIELEEFMKFYRMWKEMKCGVV